MNFKNKLFFLFGVMFFYCCGIQTRVDFLEDANGRKNKMEVIIENKKITTHQGWWIYGEGQHIFKDEKTLIEYYLEFPNENMAELRDLYLAVCEMEYYPMECSMKGQIKKKIFAKKNIFLVSDFEILYVQGCDE